MIRKIPLSGAKGKGIFATIDEDSYPEVSRYKWFYDKGYAKTRDGKLMHRIVIGAPNGMVVDHKNHDRLDNRKNNLRICTVAENSRNRDHGKGYDWVEKEQRWRVRWGKREKNGEWYEHSRRYKTEEEAKEAVKMLRSGVELPRKDKRERRIRRPKNIVRNRKYGYGFSITINKKHYCKYGFKTIADAVKYRDDFLSQRSEI